ncbi:MAG: NADPH dehydrogenase [Promethearchaeota archaeon]|nr:MAG: NADPH dehydrogenase [Candidatus Lokiarchaeota archaeon]
MIFTELTVGDLVLKNRIVMPPMCMYSANPDGKVLPFHLVHYGTRAQGGVGLIIIEATAVEPRGKISNNDLGIWNDDQIAGLRNLVEIIHGFDAKVALQLAHAGRKSEVGPAVSSSPLAFNSHYAQPISLSLDEIDQVIQAFGDGARRAHLAGFDMVEIHGAHGYLINQFLSPKINQRADEYGCKPRFGIKFLQRVITIVRKYFPNSVGLRVSAESYEPDGLHPTDYVEILRVLQSNPETRIDLLDVSSGGVTPSMPPEPLKAMYQVPFADWIKKHSDIPILTGGLITEAKQITEILLSKKADLIWLGRELLRNPYWVLKAANEGQAKMDFPIQYKRAEPYSD